MDRGTSSTLCIILLILFCKSGEAIKCFNCNSLTTKECSDPMDWAKVTYTECSLDNVQMLMKRASHGLEDKFGDLMNSVFHTNASVLSHDVKFACQKMDVVGAEGKIFNIRSCSIVQENSNGPCDAVPSSSKWVYCGVCDGNLCNSGGYCTLSLLSMSASIVLFFIFRL